MDRNLVRKLEGNKEFQRSIAKLAKDYITLGFQAVSNWTGEFDVAHDLLMAYAPVSKADFDKLERGHPKRFILPMTATQIGVMTTFMSQALFGQESPHRVEGRGPEDETAAEHINTLLRWNAEQQPTYELGYLWVQDCLTFNRGIFYNSWAPILRPTLVPKEELEIDNDGNPILDEDGNPTKYTTFRTVDTPVGGYCKMELVSPYDWACDPSLPLWKFQEGRFAAHRFKVPWTELKRRSELPPDDPMYVLPSAVETLKKKKRPAGDAMLGFSGVGGIQGDKSMSRSQHERNRANNPLANDAANKNDPGTVECVELWARIVPKDHGIYDGTSPVIFQIIVANADTVLALNESTYPTGMYPYVVGEPRPSGHYQFSPSPAIMIKGLQDHVDYLKNRHQEALQRTVGNLFIADPTMVDIEEFTNPEKEGLIIPLKAAASGRNIRDVIAQVPIKDLTENFSVEMDSMIKYSETVTGASATMQGVGGSVDSATEFAGTQQMSAGRLAAPARLLSVQALVPQTRQFVAMFQTFLDGKQIVRYQPDPTTVSPEFRNQRFLEITPDTIQGEFDFKAHDGTLPGTDSRRVAAITRLLEGAALFPQMFSPAPGNLDPRLLIFAAAKASGLNVENFVYDQTTLGQGVQGIVSAQAGVVPQFGGAAQPPGQTPGPSPATPTIPALEMPSMPSAAPSQVRPA